MYLCIRGIDFTYVYICSVPIVWYFKKKKKTLVGAINFKIVVVGFVICYSHGYTGDGRLNIGISVAGPFCCPTKIYTCICKKIQSEVSKTCF